MVKIKNRCIPFNVGGTLDGSRHFVHISKVVDNVGYSGVLDPIYHSKQTFKLRSSNITQFCHEKSMNDIHLCKNFILGL
jgi:hypothetical protein